MVDSGSSTLVIREKPTGIPPLPPVYVSPRKEVKRPKKGDGKRESLFSDTRDVEGKDDKEANGGGETTKENAGSTGSPEECRRAQ